MDTIILKIVYHSSTIAQYLNLVRNCAVQHHTFLRGLTTVIQMCSKQLCIINYSMIVGDNYVQTSPQHIAL